MVVRLKISECKALRSVNNYIDIKSIDDSGIFLGAYFKLQNLKDITKDEAILLSKNLIYLTNKLYSMEIPSRCNGKTSIKYARYNLCIILSDIISKINMTIRGMFI